MENTTLREAQQEAELETEIQSFEKEREKIRCIVGRIGGMPTTKASVWWRPIPVSAPATRTLLRFYWCFR